MPAVLITGMSGTGKSSALVELGRRGHRVVDTDDEGWLVEVDTPYGPEPVWDEDRMCSLLAGYAEDVLFVGGCVLDQARSYPRFDAVVLLSAPLDVVLARVATRTGNPFGSTSEQREKIARDIAEFEPLLRAGAHVEIITTARLETVVAELERIAGVAR